MDTAYANVQARLNEEKKFYNIKINLSLKRYGIFCFPNFLSEF